MNGPAELADGYRRLLALYPAEHRRVHEEEMLGVLLAGAPAGQRRPGLAESADLILGALRIRFRPGRHGSAERWREALAVVSVVLPLLFLLYLAVLDSLSLASPFPDNAFFAAVLRSDIETLSVWLVLTALVLLRLRRTAALVTAGMLTWAATSAAGAPGWNYIGPWSMLIFLALGIEITALLASPGPRRGLQILTWKHYALVAVVAATPGLVINWLQLSHPAVSDFVVITAIAAGVAGMAAASPLSRRVMVLLSAPAYYYIVHLVVLPSITGGDNTSGWVGSLRLTLTCLPLAVIACLLVTALFRSGRHTSPADGNAA